MPPRANLADDIWDYVAGAAETETTARRNASRSTRSRSRRGVLRDVSNVDPSGTLLGHPLRIPIVLAPLGGLELITPDGAVAQVRAAERLRPLIASVSSGRGASLEEVAMAAAGPKISQLYIRGDAAWTDELVDRAQSPRGTRRSR